MATKHHNRITLIQFSQEDSTILARTRTNPPTYFVQLAPRAARHMARIMQHDVGSAAQIVAIALHVIDWTLNGGKMPLPKHERKQIRRWKISSAANLESELQNAAPSPIPLHEDLEQPAPSGNGRRRATKTE